jgi:hypothetical protein
MTTFKKISQIFNGILGWLVLIFQLQSFVSVEQEKFRFKREQYALCNG